MRYLEKKETERVYRRLKKQTEENEAEITALEKEIADMDVRLSSGDNDALSDTSFYTRYEEKKKNLETLMQKWEEVHSELESFMSEYMNSDDRL